MPSQKENQELARLESISKCINSYSFPGYILKQEYEKLFGKEIGNDFFEGKVTLPIILLNQKANADEKKDIKNCFLNHERSESDFKSILGLIKKYDIINDCYLKAEYFIGLSSNSLSIFPDTKEKEILKKLTSFSLERNF